MKTTHNLAAQFANRKISKHKQKGNGLLYALLGMALLAIGGYYAFSIYQDKSLSSSVESDIQNVQDTIQMTQRLFGQNNDYAGQTLATLVQSGAIPPRLRIAGTNTAQNSFGQNLLAGPGGHVVANDAMTMIWPVPRAACAEFAIALAKFTAQVQIPNGTPVKQLGQPINGAAVAAACDANAVAQVWFSFGRFATQQ